MKQIFITIILVLIIEFANISYSYAAQPVKNILGKQSIDNDINKADIEKAFDTSFMKPNVPDNIVYIAVLGSIGIISGGVLLYKRKIK